MFPCVPTPNVQTFIVAIPPLSVSNPSSVAPSKKVTIPVAPPGDTVAVNTTFWPNDDGFGAVVMIVALDMRLTDTLPDDTVAEI